VCRHVHAGPSGTRFDADLAAIKRRARDFLGDVVNLLSDLDHHVGESLHGGDREFAKIGGNPFGDLVLFLEHRGWLVKAGQTLATLSFPDWAAGVDVRGRPIPPLGAATAGSDGALRTLPGSGIQVSQDGLSWLAENYGYAGLVDDQVCMLSPIWLSGDEMEACFLRVRLIAGSVIPSSQRLRDLLKASEISFGVEEEALEAFTEAQKKQSPATESLYTLARGKPEVQPKTPRPDFTIEESSGAGSLRHDGTMDFKERDLFPSVKPNAQLAEC